MEPRFLILQVCGPRDAPDAEARWIRKFSFRGKLLNGPGRVKASYFSRGGYWR